MFMNVLPDPRSILVLFLVAGSLWACDSGGTSALQCTPAAGPDEASIPITVEYTLDVSGEATVESFTYQTNEGEQTRTDVSGPQTESVQVSAGTTVSVSAEATVSDGRVEVAYDGQGQEGGTTVEIQGQDVCERRSG
jgi:hypothetical protein